MKEIRYIIKCTFPTGTNSYFGKKYKVINDPRTNISDILEYGYKSESMAKKGIAAMNRQDSRIGNINCNYSVIGPIIIDDEKGEMLCQCQLQI